MIFLWVQVKGIKKSISGIILIFFLIQNKKCSKSEHFKSNGDICFTISLMVYTHYTMHNVLWWKRWCHVVSCNISFKLPQKYISTFDKILKFLSMSDFNLIWQLSITGWTKMRDDCNFGTAAKTIPPKSSFRKPVFHIYIHKVNIKWNLVVLKH